MAGSRWSNLQNIKTVNTFQKLMTTFREKNTEIVIHQLILARNIQRYTQIISQKKIIMKF